jgi:hypothetical protein
MVRTNGQAEIGVRANKVGSGIDRRDSGRRESIRYRLVSKPNVGPVDAAVVSVGDKLIEGVGMRTLLLK